MLEINGNHKAFQTEMLAADLYTQPPVSLARGYNEGTCPSSNAQSGRGERPSPGLRVKKSGETSLLIETVQDYMQRSTGPYNYNHIYKASATNGELYEKVKPIIKGVIFGRSALMFSLGPSGTGKTYSTIGTTEDPGIMFRSLSDVFDVVEESNRRADERKGAIQEPTSPQIQIVEEEEMKYDVNLSPVLDFDPMRSAVSVRVYQFCQDSAFSLTPYGSKIIGPTRVAGLTLRKTVPCFISETFEDFKEKFDKSLENFVSDDSKNFRSTMVYSFIVHDANGDINGGFESTFVVVDPAGLKCRGLETDRHRRQNEEEAKQLMTQSFQLNRILVEYSNGLETEVVFRQSVFTRIIEPAFESGVCNIISITTNPEDTLDCEDSRYVRGYLALSDSLAAIEAYHNYLREAAEGDMKARNETKRKLEGETGTAELGGVQKLFVEKKEDGMFSEDIDDDKVRGQVVKLNKAIQRLKELKKQQKESAELVARMKKELEHKTIIEKAIRNNATLFDELEKEFGDDFDNSSISSETSDS